MGGFLRSGQGHGLSIPRGCGAEIYDAGMPKGAVLLVVATEAEAEALGAAPGREVLVSGVGKIAAATATALRLADGGLHAVICCGVAGAYPGAGLEIGDVVVATEVAAIDEGIDDGERFTPFARPGMPVPGTAWRATDPVLRSVLSVGGEMRTGRIATVSVCTGSTRTAQERAATGALCEAMEGAAVATVAARYALPFAEVRGISNPCGPRDGAPFDLEAAATAAASVVFRAVEN